MTLRELTVFMAGVRAGTLMQDDAGAGSFLYDAASGLPYDLAQGRPLRMAMSIGGENRLGFVGREQVGRFAAMAGMEAGDCLNLMANLCERIMVSVPRVVSEMSAGGVGGVTELAERLLPRLESHCRRTLQLL